MPLRNRIIPYLERAGLYHLARLNAYWFWLDEPLVSAFIKRWQPETHTFHMLFGECTITLHDVAYQLGLPVYEKPSGNRVHIRWLPFVARLDDMGNFSWGSAALAWLYRCMCRVANKNLICIKCYNADCSLRFQIVWEPYASLDVLAVIHLEILTEENSRLWWTVTSLIYFAVIEWHQVDRVFPQLGEHVPDPALNIDYLHSKDGKGGDRWLPSYYQRWHEHWDQRVTSVLSIQRVADPGPSVEYLDWWYRVAHRILSPGNTFTDPRPVEITEDAILRGSSQAPVRVSALDMPDNRRVERRRCIGTRTTDREWRWLDDIMQEDYGGGGNDRGQVDHRLRRSSARRRAALARRAPSVHHDDEAGSSHGHPSTTQAGCTAEATMGGTSFTHVSSSQVLHDERTQMFADLATTTLTMDFDDQLARPQLYADFTKLIRDDDVQRYQNPMPGAQSEPPEYRPQPPEIPSQIPDYQLPVDLNEPAGSPYDSWFSMGGCRHLNLEWVHKMLHS
ncbi:hypothetical protein Ahy_B07g086454 isoform A [Arachis hypogaea]|uniref:Aminotransferase-like plant mobile domain-containing protein n=1 Tax=Arachis hypogaea TaxID=3818 RepID=A0A444Y9U8_ARAHY|nr:hypothetical protein Ahy_B07g086454 isoform A [Arachis hypogaea]